MTSDPFKTPPRKFKLSEEERGPETPTQYSPAGKVLFSRDPRETAFHASAVEEQTSRILKKVSALDQEKQTLEAEFQRATASLAGVDPSDSIARARIESKVDGLRSKLADIHGRRGSYVEMYRRIKKEGEGIVLGGKKRRRTGRSKKTHKRKTHRRSR